MSNPEVVEPIGDDASADQRHDADTDERTLLLDDLDERFEAFQAFRKNDSEAAGRILEGFGASDHVDADIVLELSSPRPLGHPQRFLRAHTLAVRALEVLDRNGARGVKVSGVGPLGPIAAMIVQRVARYIVRSYQASVVDAMARLYARREANTLPDDPARPLLTRARIHTERIAPGFKRNPLGIPTFLLGGAVLSTFANVAISTATSALSTFWARAGAVLILGLLIAGLAWTFLRGAAVARRRIRLTTERPIDALWETIGRCGRPPRDKSRQIALIAVVLTFAPWVVIPIGLAIGFVID